MQRKILKLDELMNGYEVWAGKPLDEELGVTVKHELYRRRDTFGLQDRRTSTSKVG